MALLLTLFGLFQEVRTALDLRWDLGLGCVNRDNYPYKNRVCDD